MSAKRVPDAVHQPAATIPDGLAGRVRIGLQGPALLLGQAAGHHHPHEDVEVAPRSRPAEVRDALAPQSQLRPRLRSRPDLDLLRPLHCWNLGAGPKGRLRDRDVQLVVELGTVAAQLRMRRHVDRYVQAARRTTAGTRLALARETNLVALVDARRNRDPQRPRLFDSTLAMTGLAGALDDPAFPPAARTGGDVDHLAEHRLAYRPDLAPALALRAGGRRGAGPGPRPATGRTAIQDRELDLLLGPRHGFLERDPEVVAQIASGGRPSVSGAAGRCPTEERVEDVAEAGEAGAEARVRAAAHARSAEHVVRLASLGIRQDLVRLVDLLEPDVRLGILADVGMPLLRQPAEGALDVGVGRTPHHAQDLVVVALRHHAGKSTYRALQRRPSYVPASSRARARTSRSISAVRRPVNVFCWLGWYEPTSRCGPTWASAPCPNAGRGRAGWPRVARARRAASQPNRPSGTMTDTSSRIASSRARYGAQLSRSAIVGLLAGGAQRTAAAI